MRHGNNNWKVFWVAFRMTSLIILYLIFPLHHSLMSLSSWPIASYKLSNTGQTFHHFSSPGDIVPSPKLSLPPFPLLVNKNRHWPVFLLFFFFSPVAPNRPRIKTQSNRRGLSLGPGGGGGGGGGGWSLLVIWRRFKHSHPPPRKRVPEEGRQRIGETTFSWPLVNIAPFFSFFFLACLFRHHSLLPLSRFPLWPLFFHFFSNPSHSANKQKGNSWLWSKTKRLLALGLRVNVPPSAATINCCYHRCGCKLHSYPTQILVVEMIWAHSLNLLLISP